MNILIVGNGFDLSHFLPTKYDHFMEAMISIENFSSTSKDMNFDDIYQKLLTKESFFFTRTKELYDYQKIKLDQDQIKKFKDQLELNIWYKYFLKHVNDIKTWIDFEQKIEEALIHAVKAINIIEERHSTTRFFNSPIYTAPRNSPNSYFFTEFQFNILLCLNFIEENSKNPTSTIRVGKLNKTYFKSETNEFYGFDSNKFISFLQKQLSDFIEIFNLYLTLIINNLAPLSNFKIEELNNINKVYSFNYTNSFEKFYNSEVEIYYLHGKSGENQNLVLGISDLKEGSLKNLKAYEFTKYHQKILKNTQYDFLNLDIKKNNAHLRDLEEAKLMYRAGLNTYPLSNNLSNKVSNLEFAIQNINLNITIWGHSLDISDEVYINEIFSFNEEIDNNVRVTIYYFNNQAKSDLLTNLFHILGKDKVERWMKNKWLEFKENPSNKKTIKPVLSEHSLF
ncbi:AbiH family protein [Acinetobacter pittii]|uniref:AbiH family protein n=1 Tax=Acinetobacter pittii TaxID=48296 RepID=UPI00102F1837|nr:AbiH family protein [Acinetobacter pittii]RZH00371.1 hypothetical protein EXE03_02300 [Acinetobacter pittii]